MRRPKLWTDARGGTFTPLGWALVIVIVLAVAVPLLLKIDRDAARGNARDQAAAIADGAAWARETAATGAQCEFAWASNIPDARSHGLWDRYWLRGCHQQVASTTTTTP